MPTQSKTGNKLLWFLILPTIIFILAQLFFIFIFGATVEQEIILLAIDVIAIIVLIILTKTVSHNKDSNSLNFPQNLGQVTTSAQNLYTDLEQKVTEKTQELSQKISELTIAKAKDEAILNSIIDGMVVTDINGNITMINYLASQLLNLKMNPTIQQSAFSIPNLYKMDGSPISHEENPFFFSLKYGQKMTQDFLVKRADGSKIIISLSCTAIKQEEKRVGAIAMLRDITHEKEVDRMKTEFISLASHQLRTPLSAIKWFTEMLLAGDGGALNGEQTDFAKNISASTERMIQLVNGLLNISRIESGRIIIDPKPTDLVEMVKSLIEELKVKILEKKQKLIISAHETLPLINIDPKLIRQVYMNLLTNAIKYTPEAGEISIFISKKENEIISQVTDSGFGIPLSQQNKIFQKFFRADNAVKVETDGTGLGLYLAKAIVESSSGKMWFKSEEGKGTSFWFSLPVAGTVAKKGEVSLD